MVNTATLWPAVGWTCDHCGRDNFARMVCRTNLEVDAAGVAAAVSPFVGAPAGSSPAFSKFYVLTGAPSHVTCTHCHASFDADFMGMVADTEGGSEYSEPA